jgi:hypothetical protein
LPWFVASESRAVNPSPTALATEKRGVKVSTEIVQPGAAAVPTPQPVPKLENDIQGPSVPFDASLSCEALAFWRLHGIESELRLAIGTARRWFPIIGNPDVELVHDRKTEDVSYLIIARRSAVTATLGPRYHSLIGKPHP